MQQQSPALLRGFLAALAQRDNALAQRCLDECPVSGPLAPALPALQDSVGWNDEGIKRLRQALCENRVPIEKYRYLYGVMKPPAAVQKAAGELLIKVAGKPQGFSVAVNVLMMWHGTAEICGVSP